MVSPKHSSSRSLFEVPLPDALSNILEAIDHHGINNPHYPVFRYEDIDSTVRTINWGQAVQAFDVSARLVSQRTAVTESSADSRSKVIGILANLDSITYYTLIIGIMKAGFTPFPISIRNSAEAVAHLLVETGCTMLFATEDVTTHQLAVSACNILGAKGSTNKTSAHMLQVPTFEQLYRGTKVETEDLATVIPHRKILDPTTAPCIILHSSGTTSFPKPVVLTHSMMFEHGSIHRNEGSLEGHILAAHAVPFYHLMGIFLIPWSAILGVTISVFRPSRPPIVPSPDLVLRGAVATASSLIWCASSFLENWALDASNAESLKRFDKVMFGGGPVQMSVGNSLVERGVRLISLLGLTEVGVITNISPKHSEGWLWQEVHPRVGVIFIPEDTKNRIFRLAVKQNEAKTPATLNIEINGVRAFDTKDLVQMHSTVPNLWRIYGRYDEQIMHSTGEKTNPFPIETMLSKSPYIASALMFGRARFQAGVIIVPSPDYAVDNSEQARLHDYVELIWDVVIATNRHSPRHSRIFKEMILVADPQRPFEYTAKGTTRRQVTLAKYELDIERLYEAAEFLNPAELQVPRSGELENITTFLRAIVHNILGQKVEDKEDIFRVGADSLSAHSIRNSITGGLLESGVLSSSAVQALPRDLVYILPSISMMSAFISGAVLIESLLGKSIAHATLNDEHPATKIEEEEELHDAGNADLRWQSILESHETVVEIVPARGEPPFIVLHGANGNAEVFRAFMSYTSGLWAIQVSDDTPQDSLEEQAAFYYSKIKEKQPHGPYRLGSYSGSSLILVELVSQVERSGEDVIQFAMIDHFPTYFFPAFRPDDAQIDNPEWIKNYVRRAFQVIYDTFAPRLAAGDPALKQLAQELADALNGLPGTPGARQWIQRMEDMHVMSIHYLMRDEFLEHFDEDGRALNLKKWSPDRFRKFVSSIKARLNIYVGTEGVHMMLPEHLKHHKDDLGARVFFPDARVISIQGNHHTLLADDVLRRSIEADYSDKETSNSRSY